MVVFGLCGRSFGNGPHSLDGKFGATSGRINKVGGDFTKPINVEVNDCFLQILEHLLK